MKVISEQDELDERDEGEELERLPCLVYSNEMEEYLWVL